ncbi:tRNA-dihydrouridine synthase family protein [Leptospira sp. 2 VSF19]|uniref:tRNA-dihydrouridine synthase n=1 Tax=Leptospira soteropolitanensis TaxID=2950025 RepID=A0AAW5VJN6_9LEPT|nr:tRNA-dihydrouridine synthase family protein [Leptospira soteropolitanensis]MCW7491557.1 tRNA-dihydrouridine synthase family protein [Leptospira soteropolitanensis]MCW7499141.1 tRNA-dihydrouridine synthase family protein [Leptospira soteropolitanensis]MCW7521267.1 tRNA-dihydrouridine synthase family protein [Leptospira soteropolitanensis]MCW7525245.1 tRNA-dihydrouridine synthase family protein [Leptospira soteropolitanensis]MCW7529112.1 tRNA-dihydrouridine synthase family protein [Leptospira
MITIGGVTIKGDVVLSPMAGISDSPYRQITRRFGSAFAYTEFVSTEQLLIGNTKSLYMFRYLETERPIFFQIFGSDLDTVVNASEIAASKNPDVIDLNMGCSVAKVSHHGSGAGLLRNVRLAGAMIEGIRKKTGLPVTAKIRLGWDSNSLNYLETVKVLEGSGVSAISVHGRTKAMAYTGFADWNAIGEIKSKANVPIFGNGDVASFSEAMFKKKKYGVDLVLIGRKAIGNPWIFSERPKEVVGWLEIKAVILEHLNLMLNFYPSDDDYALVLFRKHFIRYIENTGFPEDTKRELLAITNVNQFIDKLESVQMDSKFLETSEIKNENINCETFVSLA